MKKTCCICRANFIPTGENAETLHWCSKCREELAKIESDENEKQNQLGELS